MPTPTTVQARFQVRADTAANWTAANPTLLLNEIGIETDTKKLKLGDGTTAWASLAYFPSIVTGGTVLGNLEIGTTGTLTFEGSTADAFETTLAVVNPTADRTITLPNITGTVVTTGDTGTVTSTMIADGTIVNADVNASAAIAGTKISPDFGAPVVHPLGAAATPSLTFTGDLNTGIFSPSADTIAFSKGGNEALRIDSSSRLLLGTSSAFSEFNGPDSSGWTGLCYVADNRYNSTFHVSNWTNNASHNNSGGTIMMLSRCKSGTIGTHTSGALSSGEDIGRINFNASDGTNFITAALIQAEVDGTPGANDMPGRLVLSTTSDGASSPIERVRINSSGNVGIGAISGIVARLHVRAADSDTPAVLLRLEQFNAANTDGARLEIQANAANDLVIYDSTGTNAGGHVFETGGTEALRITNDGVICYNQPSPTSKSAAATLTVAELKTGIIQYTGSAATLTLPTGTLTEGGFSGIYTNMTFEYSVINTGSGTCTIGAGTNHTIVGAATIASGASGRFAARRTASNTFISYRLS